MQAIFHGYTLPRGLEKLYPNFLAIQVVLASEKVFFNEDSAKKEPFDLTFTYFVEKFCGFYGLGGNNYE